MANKQADHESERIAIFLPRFGQGGVERMLINLAEELGQKGYAIDVLLTGDKKVPFIDETDTSVNYIRFFSSDVFKLLFSLKSYLKNYTPDALVSAKLKKGHTLAVLARNMAKVPTRVYLRIGTHLSRRNKGKIFTKKIRDRVSLRYAARRAEGVIAVSEGIREDVQRIAGISDRRVHVVPNPTVSRRIHALANEPVSHAWLREKDVPVVLGVGSLRNQKNFSTLIRAFAILRQSVEARLIILGEGRQGPKLRELAAQLSVSDCIDFPGFVHNPYAYMARSDLFVMSSAWEGSPNVLIEAMALGTPVVSTDCPSGPSEILHGGKYGSLVPVGDYRKLAEKMRETLENPLSANELQEAIKPYGIENSVRKYLEVMNI